MSVWRIRKLDAQTRSLAETAARAAGLPVGVWLERAILRRVENRQAADQQAADQQALATPPAGTDTAQEPPAQVSAEMQSALDAAERRRRERAGEAPSDTETPPALDTAQSEPPPPADPFAAPEKVSEESPFEQPAAAADENSDALDATLAAEAETIARDASAIQSDDAETDIAALPPLDDEAMPIVIGSDDAEDPAQDEPAIFPDETILITTRQEVPAAAMAADNGRPRRQSGLLLTAAGLAVAVVAGAAAYLLLADRPKPPASETAAAAPAPAAPAPATPAPTAQADAAATPPAPQPAPPPQPEPAAAATEPTPSAPPTPSPPASEPTATAAAPAEPADLPRSAGPSILNMAMGDASPQPVTMPATPSVAAVPPPPETSAAASESLPSLIGRAEAGDIPAQMELGRRYIQGVGVGRNEAEAAKWLRRAAEKGEPQAQFNIGVMYERGVGLPADLSKAIEYYRKSAAQRTPMALHNLALIHSADQPGLKADPVQARRLMTQAAELGQIESQYSLALMHLQGLGGPVDRVTAMAWLALAARPNQPQLIENARQLAAQLSPAERQRAERMAEANLKKVRANLQQLQATATPAGETAAGETPARPRVIDRLAITEIQKLLAALKLYGGAADGVMGPRTAAAIREFQEMAGLPVDGKPSLELLDSLSDVAGMTNR